MKLQEQKHYLEVLQVLIFLVLELFVRYGRVMILVLCYKYWCLHMLWIGYGVVHLRYQRLNFSLFLLHMEVLRKLQYSFQQYLRVERVDQLLHDMVPYRLLVLVVQ